MPTFVGLDLAWSAHKESGVSWIEGQTPEDLTCHRIETAVVELQRLAEELAAATPPLVVAIDAPLLYTAQRWAEREVAHRFARYHASPHQASNAVRQGYTAGLELACALQARGVSVDPRPLLDGVPHDRTAVEVFPHTIHVHLFGLAERIPYKPGRRRSVASRRDAFRTYQRHLHALLARETPGLLADAHVQRALSRDAVSHARGAALKRLDDTLDGLTCAMAAWLMWRDPSRWECIGDLNGYIVAPRPTSAREQIPP